MVNLGEKIVVGSHSWGPYYKVGWAYHQSQCDEFEHEPDTSIRHPLSFHEWKC